MSLRIKFGTSVIHTLVWAMVYGLASAAGAANEVAFRDDFDALELQSGWSILRDQPEDHSLTERPGFFRIQTRRGILGEEASVDNLLLRDISGDFILEARVEFNPTTAQQFAGLIAFVDDDHIVAVGLAFATGDRGEFRGIVLLSLGDDPESDTQAPGARYDESNADDPNAVYLRLLRKDDQFVGAFSADGVVFTDIGTISNDLPQALTVGVGAANGDRPECGSACDESIPADFDFFEISTLDSGQDVGTGGEPAVEIGLDFVEVIGPEQVSAGATVDFVAQATYTDGTSSDVSDQAEWTVAPAELGQVDGGRFTAASVDSAGQVTLVATYSQLTSGGQISRTGSTLVRIDQPVSGGGGSAGGGLCGAGLVPICLVCVTSWSGWTLRRRGRGLRRI